MLHVEPVQQGPGLRAHQVHIQAARAHGRVIDITAEEVRHHGQREWNVGRIQHLLGTRGTEVRTGDRDQGRDGIMVAAHQGRAGDDAPGRMPGNDDGLARVCAHNRIEHLVKLVYL